MLKQIEWLLQNGLITKSGVLISLENLLEHLNQFNRIFRKRWSLISGFFFPVSVLKGLYY